jgi:DNA-binding transcriptional ArsR family regulator
VNFFELDAIYKKWLYLDHDPSLVKCVFAAYIANRYDGPPVWIMIIGKPGCGKSELLMSMSDYKNTVPVSKLTPNALASGFQDGKYSLLHDLVKDKVLIIKDMSTITEMASEARGQIFSDLRDAYDGSFVKRTGSNKVEFKGKFGLIAGATPAIDRTRTHEGSLGERFLNIRVRLDDHHERQIQERTGANIEDGGNKKMKKELAAAASKFLDSIKLGVNTKITRGFRDDVYTAARVLAKARSSVLRDRFTREVDSPAGTTEVPTRITAQLLLLAVAIKEMGGDEEEMLQIVHRFAFDSMPMTRVSILKALESGAETAKQIREHVRMSIPAIDRHLQDLWYLKLVENDMGKYVVTDEDLVAMMAKAK